MEFAQIEWDGMLVDDCRQIIRLAVREDLDRSFDLTTLAIVPAGATAAATIVSRQDGIAAGIRTGELVVEEMNLKARWTPLKADGDAVQPGTALARIEGSARDLLTAERLLLNLMGRLGGIASLTAKYVEQVEGTHARIYDTRKTTPGYRRLEKYAVRCGGGQNHRTGLFDAVLIKDNHLAQLAKSEQLNEKQAVERAREFLAAQKLPSPIPIEIEVDTLEQFETAIPANPDLILLDNMTIDQLEQAVMRRNEIAPNVELEASGGIQLGTVSRIARSGVDRISVGALTHSAVNMDIGLDWSH